MDSYNKSGPCFQHSGAVHYESRQLPCARRDWGSLAILGEREAAMAIMSALSVESEGTGT